LELRKVHRTGEAKSSYFLTLPHDLVRALGITDGDYVSISILDDKLVIVPVQEKPVANSPSAPVQGSLK
jgi:antitoxin component of MazEF toxin-antitoxin module